MDDEHHSEPALTDYPVGRGYGHDYMRGGEVFGGYGYSEREEYAMPRGTLHERQVGGLNSSDDDALKSPT
jgi:hypothetical protein